MEQSIRGFESLSLRQLVCKGLRLVCAPNVPKLWNFPFFYSICPLLTLFEF
jgi:hypothetical protein